MKKIMILFIGLLLTGIVYGQVGQAKIEKQTSLAEQFSATAGTLMEKQLIDIGKVKGLSLL